MPEFVNVNMRTICHFKNTIKILSVFFKMQKHKETPVIISVTGVPVCCKTLLKFRSSLFEKATSTYVDVTVSKDSVFGRPPQRSKSLKCFPKRRKG